MLYGDPDKLTNQEKVALGLDVIKRFFDTLGPDDVYKQIVLEEVMRYLLGEPTGSEHLEDVIIRPSSS